MLRFGSFEFHADAHRLTSNGQAVHLTPKAFDLLHLLIDKAPGVASKEEIHAQLWPGQAVSDATLVGLIKEIRRALNDRNTDCRIIRTVHRVGYAFDASLTTVPDALPSNCLLVIDGRSLELVEGENAVGRDPLCDIWLDEATVSRRHARIIVGREHVTLEDLGSKNGTCVGNDALVGSTRLNDGDRIRFGSVRALFFVSPSARPTQTQLSINE